MFYVTLLTVLHVTPAATQPSGLTEAAAHKRNSLAFVVSNSRVTQSWFSTTGETDGLLVND